MVVKKAFKFLHRKFWRLFMDVDFLMLNLHQFSTFSQHINELMLKDGRVFDNFNVFQLYFTNSTLNDFSWLFRIPLLTWIMFFPSFPFILHTAGGVMRGIFPLSFGEDLKASLKIYHFGALFLTFFRNFENVTGNSAILCTFKKKKSLNGRPIYHGHVFVAWETFYNCTDVFHHAL